MSYLWSAVGAEDVAILARRALAALPPGGLVFIHDFMVDDVREGHLLQRGTCRAQEFEPGHHNAAC